MQNYSDYCYSDMAHNHKTFLFPNSNVIMAMATIMTTMTMIMATSMARIMMILLAYLTDGTAGANDDK